MPRKSAKKGGGAPHGVSLPGVPAPPLPAGTILCPFTIVVDSSEQLPYGFQDIRAGFVRNNPPAHIPTVRLKLSVGDYSIFGYPSIVIERKSLSDLYNSVRKRSNFIGRLERMSELTYSAVVVEAEYYDVINHPPIYTKMHPRSMSRTLISWGIKYPVRWHFYRNRRVAEVMTYRLLEKYWLIHRKDHKVPLDYHKVRDTGKTTNDPHTPDNLGGAAGLAPGDDRPTHDSHSGRGDVRSTDPTARQA